MRLNEIYRTYKEKVEFLNVYIREAHPDDGWRVPDNLENAIHFKEPTTDDERTGVASVCQVELDLELPFLIDSIDNDVEEKYIAMPMRCFVVDAEGKIAYSGGQGPREFDEDEWEEAIKKLVG